MSNYVIRAGDDFGTVSRNVYGSEDYATRIAQSNPGVVEPLVVGSVINVPQLAFEPIPTNQSRDPDDVLLIIGGKVFRFWTEIAVSASMDSVDTVTFEAPFDPNDPEFRESFKPFTFAAVSVFIGGDQVFTGRMINIVPSLNTTSRTVRVECYATPGVLMDSTIPASMYPVNEFRNQTIRQIAETICPPLSVFPQFLDDPGAKFEKVAIEPDAIVWDFLANLAKQRNLIMKNNQFGQLVFYRETSSDPVAVFREGSSPLLTIQPDFRPRTYYSHVTGIDGNRVGNKGSQYTVKNDRLTGYLRPLTYRVEDTERADMKSAVETKIGRMFANMVSYAIGVSTWRQPNGERWTPGSIVTVEAPGAMIYNDYNFTIRNVVFTATPTSRVANIELMIPGSFAGKIPEFLPWD